MLLPPVFFSPRPQDSPHTYSDERKAEDLSHVNGQACLEGLLHFLGVFDGETESENKREAETEVEPCPDLLRMFPVNQEDDNEEDEVSNGFIELPGMARVGVDIVEDEP